MIHIKEILTGKPTINHLGDQLPGRRGDEGVWGGMMTKDQLGALAGFLPALEKPDFEAGEIRPPREMKPGVFTMPYTSYSRFVLEMVKTLHDRAWIVPGFDWPGWARSPEAVTLRGDEAALANATPEQLARLLTVVVRQDRFVEGALLEAFASGLILHIIRRAAAILAAENAAPPG
jgi:hypothetical protein